MFALGGGFLFAGHKAHKGCFFYFLFESQASGQLSFALVKVILYCNSWFLWHAESANLSFPLSGAFNRMLGISSSHHHSILARTWSGFIQQCSPKLWTSQMKTLKLWQIWEKKCFFNKNELVVKVKYIKWRFSFVSPSYQRLCIFWLDFVSWFVNHCKIWLLTLFHRFIGSAKVNLADLASGQVKSLSSKNLALVNDSGQNIGVSGLIYSLIFKKKMFKTVTVYLTD